MKRNLLFKIIALLMLSVGIEGCSSEGGNNAFFQMKNNANSGCKHAAGTRGESSAYDHEYVEYKGLANGYLALKHVNALFNCEPGKLEIQASIDGNEIRILENEELSLANCVCPYDLYCEVGPLSFGKYTLILCRGSFEYGEIARFTINYSIGLNGRFNIRQ